VVVHATLALTATSSIAGKLRTSENPCVGVRLDSRGGSLW